MNNVQISLPPCGGSGLKSINQCTSTAIGVSPSMRREWIEIKFAQTIGKTTTVSLHAEGVD